MLNNLNFRRVQSSDLKEIIKLFEVVFKKKLQRNFISGDILINHTHHL